MIPDPPSIEPTERLSIELKVSTLTKIEKLRVEWGLRSRGETLQRLLDELFDDQPRD